MRLWLVIGLFLLFVEISFTAPCSVCAEANQEIGDKKSLADINPAELGEWSIRRVEFLGNEHVRDYTIRRHFIKSGVEEGDIFDPKKVKRVLARINRLGLFEKVTEKDVTCSFVKEYNVVDLLIVFHELPKVKSRKGYI